MKKKMDSDYTPGQCSLSPNTLPGSESIPLQPFYLPAEYSSEGLLYLKIGIDLDIRVRIGEALHHEKKSE